CGKWHR
ncbi:unnamed protein product, partial [Fusarium fujikuroi]